MVWNIFFYNFNSTIARHKTLYNFLLYFCLLSLHSLVPVPMLHKLQQCPWFIFNFDCWTKTIWSSYRNQNLSFRSKAINLKMAIHQYQIKVNLTSFNNFIRLEFGWRHLLNPYASAKDRKNCMFLRFLGKFTFFQICQNDNVFIQINVLRKCCYTFGLSN